MQDVNWILTIISIPFQVIEFVTTTLLEIIVFNILRLG